MNSFAASTLSAVRAVGARLSLDTSADRILFDVLDRALRDTRMRFELPDRTWEVGTGEVAFVVRVTDPAFARSVLTSGNLGLAESYMSGGWTLAVGRLDRFLSALASSDVDREIRRDPRVLARVAAMRVQHAFTGAARNVGLHYDVGPEIYELFLDETMGYTCGYQQSPDDTLRRLQENKYDRICQKIGLAKGDTLLDIGCGWGSFVIHAAQNYGAKVHGVTLAKNQAAYANQRAKELGLEGSVTVEHGDFREVLGTYDKIVSIEMIEHLYPREHDEYFDFIDRRLHADGVALVHFMGCTSDRNDPDPFVQKYIFPGSTHPQLSSVVSQLEKRRMPVLDVENIVLHYLPVTQRWFDNFEANKHRIDTSRYDDRFVRMYEYLLALYVAGCTALVAAVFQVLFTKNYKKNVRLHRI